MISAKKDIWVFASHREGSFEAETYGLIAEAGRLIAEPGGTVTAIVLGTALEGLTELPGAYGADRVIYADSDALARYNGELFAQFISDLTAKYKPYCILMAQNPVSSDLAPRIAAITGADFVSRAMDFNIYGDGNAAAIRPVSNGYLFEKLGVNTDNCPVICFLPSVLASTEPDQARKAKIIKEAIDINSYNLRTKITKVAGAAPEELNIDEADIVVAGGRGAGKESFNIIHDLAKAIGGSVGATRPVIDWQVLPFERQIGQTGKTVTPRLIVNCGISGANEYTAGIEKSQFVIAINNDPQARIFRFADLGVIGDLHEVLPRVIEKIKNRLQIKPVKVTGSRSK